MGGMGGMGGGEVVGEMDRENFGELGGNWHRMDRELWGTGRARWGKREWRLAENRGIQSTGRGRWDKQGEMGQKGKEIGRE